LQFKQKRKGVLPPKLAKIKVSWNKLDDLEVASQFEEVAMNNLRELMSKGIPLAKAFLKSVAKDNKKGMVYNSMNHTRSSGGGKKQSK
jgi:hypothetical protein